MDFDDTEVQRMLETKRR